MITYPDNWKNIGQPIELKKIEDTILEVLSEISCNCLSFSGGLDSSLLLYFMTKIHKRINAFTIGLSDKHPDIIYSRFLVNKFLDVKHYIYIPSSAEIDKERKDEDFKGDNAVRLFYRFVAQHTDGIIVGDGVDEFMCGYYEHQHDVRDKVYYDYIRRLQKEHLIPLDKNSGKVKVCLPYVDKKIIYLLSQIPLNEKVDVTMRKKLMIKMSKGKIPQEIINRRKYGFCDSFEIKGESNGNTT